MLSDLGDLNKNRGDMELRRGKAFLLHEEEENMSGFSIFCKLRGCVTRAGMTLGWRAHQLG